MRLQYWWKVFAFSSTLAGSAVLTSGTGFPIGSFRGAFGGAFSHDALDITNERPPAVFAMLGDVLLPEFQKAPEHRVADIPPHMIRNKLQLDRAGPFKVQSFTSVP